MIKAEQYINEISFEEAYIKLDREQIDYLMKGDLEAKYSINLKKKVFLLVSLFMPISMIISYTGHNKSIETTMFSRNVALIVSMIFIIVSLISFFKSNMAFKNYGYKEFAYTSLKILFLSYICGSIGTVDSNYVMNLITITIYVSICILLYYLVENNMMVKYINLTFGRNYKTSKTLSILIKVSGLVAVLGIILVQLYRFNKSWLDPNTLNSTVNSFDLNMYVTVILGVFFMIVISLIPTYFSFRPDLRIQNKLVLKYSEEFRENYGYYKKEWDIDV